MKTFVAVAVAMCMGLSCLAEGEAPAAGKEETPAPVSGPTLVWCGIDYSKVKMIGTMDFNNPETIFPGMLESWNGLFVSEFLPKLEKKLAATLVTDTKAVAAANAKVTAKCIVREDGTEEEKVVPTDITQDQIASMVKGYALARKDGIGFVLIMDRMVKAQQKSCIYVVFFDVASRKVLLSERRIEKAAGAGFRNYWFGAIKRSVKDLPELLARAQGTGAGQ